MWAEVRHGTGSLSRRLVASYVLVAVVLVVLVETFVVGYEVPRVLREAQLHNEVVSTSTTWWAELSQQYPGGVPAGALLGERGQPPEPGTARSSSDGTALVVPAVPGPISSPRPLTAVVAIARDGTILASSAPGRYPAGQPAAAQLPPKAAASIQTGKLKGVNGSTGRTPYGAVSWTLFGQENPPWGLGRGRAFAFLYVQAPQPTGLANPIRTWDQLGQVTGSTTFYGTVILLVIAPLAALLGLLASRRLVRRVRRLEHATVAVVDGDYTVRLRSSGRDDVGRLEANVAAMARQLSSAMSAERERVASEARAAERSRIAREIHDAISQHLFGLRMITSGMRRSDPPNEQVRAIERIVDEAQRDMQALLLELRPAGLDRAGLAPALERICAAYRDRLGVTVDAELATIALPEAVEDALLRVTQEACTNAVRHGNAQRLAVSMARRDGQVELAVRDDGAGFDPATSLGGAGLQHIRDRVRELGGTVTIDSAPGAGTAVTVLVPAP